MDTTESDKSASYLDILLNIDSNGKLTTSIYDKRDDFDYVIFNFTFLYSNIPFSPAYGLYISQLIRYTKACYVNEEILKRGKLLTENLMLQGYYEPRLMSSFCKFCSPIMTFLRLQIITRPYADLFLHTLC
jgi:hypothetical protein